MASDYITAADLKSAIGINDAAEDSELGAAITAASRMIDDYCDRWFDQLADQTRIFTPITHDLVVIDDLVSITSLKTDEDDDGAYEVTWDASDYRLLPPNANTDGHPYTQVRRRGSGRAFPRAPESVEVVGTFGWPAVPDQVKQACRIQAVRLYKRVGQAPFGVADIAGVDGMGIRLRNRLDPDVEVLLHDLRRHVVKVG